ncbi:DDE-type integrase/transposase/recombinase [Carnobacterium mobile]|uniref:DDE-type integrase/transposase/recombinase n=1 Tax=Carnobacterium mobile TaxID=2750 RepID=UPI0012EC15EA|nr:DDE-type integrase/transposase/recombinase [Carnobacterium mobile]
MKWTGQTMTIIDPDTNEPRKAYLFVATLPYSQYSYVEVTSDMKQENWITAHVNMFHFFGGVTPLVICDNLKIGVINHPRNGEVVLNTQCRELSDYYNTAILPA